MAILVRRPRIGTVLLAIILVALALPLGGVWLLRLYESALIRQTESELIAQGAVIAAAYRAAWRGAGGRTDRLLPPADPRWVRPAPELGNWLPHSASLDLAEDPVLPFAPDPEPAAVAADPVALAAGSVVSDMLRDAQRTTLAGIRVVDPAGTVIASTGPEIGLSLAGREEVRRALDGAPVSLMRLRVPADVEDSLGAISRATALRVFTALPVIEDGRLLGAVVLSRTPRTIGQALYGKRWHLATAGVVILTVAVGLGAVGALAIAWPLRNVTAQARQVAAGGSAAAAAAERPRVPLMVREVAELTQAIDRMAATLERRAAYIQGFASQVSHEFKTPLAAIRGTVELLRDHLDSMSAEERARFLGNLDADAERLDRLVRRLLELARADVMAAAGDSCEPLAVVERLAERYRAEGMRLAVELRGDGRSAIAEEAVETVLRNLLDNVRQHAGADAAATVTVAAASDAVVLTVADDGPGISPGNRPRVFERFFTTARKAGGTGLGLSIAESLVVAARGQLRLVPSERGACFELTLPSAGPQRA